MVHIQYVSLDEQKCWNWKKRKKKKILIFFFWESKKNNQGHQTNEIKCKKVEGIVCIVKKFEFMYDFSDD